MFSRKEIISILIVTILLGFTISLIKSTRLFLYSSMLIFFVIIANAVAKKIAAYYLEANIELGIWEVIQYGIRKPAHFKRPFPAGVFFPLILTAISLGRLTWFAPLTFEVKPKKYRAVRRHGLYAFTEMTEEHIGLIAFAGIVINLALAVVGYLINQPEFSRLNIYFAAFNMLPMADLDGNKIFFGNFSLWATLCAVVFIALAYAIILI